ncbi:NAD-dependent epimerase/dehydratase family protein [Thiomicrorhabdus indica]|uniref:NAD-dependent epimerase/dehydratase family protein n=1 Tax=Thiomicrorhabdus indica TaxID=2267253 RepID=UPI00102E0B61|nr:NAD-dependent epimerase/dehydratase family protein [Thiomicrorhabdus indica]
MASILIAGCGSIGCQLGQQLAQEHTVYGLRRTTEYVPDNLHAIEADLNHKIEQLPDEIDYAFFMPTAGKYKDSAYYNAYVLNLKNLLNGLQDKNIKRLFFISSTSVFSQNDGEVVNEESPTDPHSFSTKRILEGEELALSSSTPTTIIRLGGIYGPGRTHLIDLVREGKAHCMEDVWSNRIHSDDCVGVLAHLLNLDVSGAKLENIYLGVDCEPSLSCEVYSWLAEQLSVPEIEHMEPTENSRLMRSNKKISNARLLESGYEFKFPNYRLGYTDLIENETFE